MYSLIGKCAYLLYLLIMIIGINPAHPQFDLFSLGEVATERPYKITDCLTL